MLHRCEGVKASLRLNFSTTDKCRHRLPPPTLSISTDLTCKLRKVGEIQHDLHGGTKATKQQVYHKNRDTKNEGAAVLSDDNKEFFFF